MRFLLFLLVFLTGAASAKEPKPAPLDPDIQAMISSISAERIQRSIFVLTSFKTRHTLSDPLPSGDGIGGASSWVRAEFERVSEASGHRLHVQTDEFDQPPQPPRIPRRVKIVNIVATLPGSRADSADRIYVLSAHYDSRTKNALDASSPAPGADDDASGVAAVLELARVMSGYQFPSTLVFMAVAGGEQGRVGSAHWADEARQNGFDIAGVIDDDGIGSTHAADGRIDRHTVRLFAQGVPPVGRPGEALLGLIRSGGENDTRPRELARAIRDIGARYMPSMNVHIVFRGNSSVRAGFPLPFVERGYPAVVFTEAAENSQHRHEADLTDFVEFSYVADVARLNAAAIAAMARAPAPPRAVEIEPGRPEDGTMLRWIRTPVPYVAGYRVVWRDTTQPFWEHSLDVPKDATRAKVGGVSQEDAIFGVEAFDNDGHVSPAAYAMGLPAP